MKSLSAICVGVCLLLAVPASAQNPSAPIDYDAVRETKVVQAVRITEEITLDGRLEEPVWQLAIPAVDFYQWTPDPGQLSSEKTEVRFLYETEVRFLYD